MAWLQPPPTPTLEWQEVEARVAEVMDQVHDLHLQSKRWVLSGRSTKPLPSLSWWSSSGSGPLPEMT